VLSQVCPDPCETLDNEFNQSNVRGSVSVPLSAGNPDSGSTGWFVNVSNNASLDASFFTVFAHVIGDGMSVVDEINGLFRLSIGLTSPPGGTPMTPDFVCNPNQQGACQTPPSPYLVFTEITRVPAPDAPAAGLASVLALAALARRRSRAR
jgi:cyclophilin family peptidyl-prolyl cis-trans isomerase